MRPFGGRGSDPAEAAFYAGIPVDPSPRIYLENGSSEHTMRAIDLICPIGMGQRGLIVAQPGSGKTTILKHICQAVGKAYPEVKLYCLLVDERPEEVTDFKRSVTADVRASSSDQDYEHHVKVADDLMHEAMREAGAGKNVMVMIDSLTRLSRVHNAEIRSSGRTISGGLDSRAIEVPRRIFGAARKIENGGSLTILATILVETGSRMDDVIFEEFKGTGNMEVVLSRELASRRIYPAIDIPKSATRKMELLMPADELKKVEMLRRALLNYKAVEAGSALIKQLNKYPTNKEFLAAVGEVISGD
ncbi:MAG: transcription termination factor Rho [Candidatus Omnitrophota bacterium]